MGVHPVLIRTTPLDIHKYLRRVPALHFRLPGERETKETKAVLDACPFAEVNGLGRHNREPEFWRSNPFQVGCLSKEGKDLVTRKRKPHRGGQGVQHRQCCAPWRLLQETVWSDDPCVSTLSAHVLRSWPHGDASASRWAAPWNAVASATWSTPRSGAPPDTHRHPRTSAPGLPNTDYTRGHVETLLQSSGYSLLPTRHDRAGKRPIGGLV